jgi:hypothetical protein
MLKTKNELERFARLSFDEFKKLAQDDALSPHEKIGFPDSYREDMEERILADLWAKVTNLASPGGLAVDIGAGCGRLTHAFIERCRRTVETLVLIDSHEMLEDLPNDPLLLKLPGRFPDDCAAFLEKYRGRVDAIIVYSVLHYVFIERSVFDFLDRCLELLAPRGQLLLGDVPNRSMRDRFFSSDAGKRFHREFMQCDDDPHVERGAPIPGEIDDSVVLALLHRARAAGFDAFVLPQAPDLPMANRREDILVRKP